ncbi:hypothetical protein IMQ36_06760 [Providencia rettgeri]|nr:hypothetical protein [Providencia rettgeri]QPE19526.1 hypothetical protein IMQ36_06760 [Providencia rettgeri]
MREVKPTQKPVPSSDIKDLFFNSGLLDIWATSLERKYIDRFGNCHLTAAGMEWLFKELVEKFKVDMNTAIVAAGYITIDSFQRGADLPNNELTQRNHILRDETTGEYYRWDGDLPKQVPEGSTPQSTGGIGKGTWVSVGDASLRSDIKNVDGAAYVGSTNYAGLRGYTGANRKIDVYGRNNIFDGGDGIFILDATDVSTVDNDVTILVDALNRRWKREVKNGHYDARWAGVVADGITDNTEAFAKLSATIKKQHSVMLVPAGVIKTGSIKLPVEYCEIRGAGKYSTVIQFLDKSNSIKIMEACKVSHVTISGVGAWLGANAHDVLILDDKEHNRSDVDLYVDNCLLNNTKFVARIFGRGFELTNCNTNDLSEYILDLQFPEPFEPGPDPSLHSIIEGMRHYKFLNNRIHYAGKGLINNTGYNAVNAKNFLISGNSFEGNITILNGYMKGAVITGNEFVHGYNQRIFNANGLEDIIFTDNNVDFKIGGYSDQTQTQIFSSNGTFKNITIKDNGFKNLNRQVVYLHGTGDKINDRSDIIISGNSYDNCFGSLTHLFELQTGSIDRLTVDETLKSPSESWMPIFQSIGMYAIKNYSVSAKATGSNEVHNLHSSYSTGGMKKQGTYNGNGSSQVIKVGFMPRNVLVRGSNGSMTIITPEMPNTGGATMGDINNRSFTVSGLVNTNGQQYVWVAES